MTFVVTFTEAHEGSYPVAAFTELSGALAYCKERAENHAIQETEDLRRRHEATITRYYEQIKQHGPDHVPDELELRTTTIGGPPDPWVKMTLAERLASIEARGPGVCAVRDLSDEHEAGYAAGDYYWSITELHEDQHSL